MNDEQIRLIAGILNGLCSTPIEPYWSMGVDLGVCRYCGAIGEIYHVFHIEWKHNPACITVLNEQLQQSLKVE